MAKFGPKQMDLWRSSVYLLRKHCPTAVRVRKVCRSHAKTLGGPRGDLAVMETYLDREGKLSFVDIRIRQSLSFQHSIDLLIHEWAHAMLAPIDQHIGADHGPTWGVSYARCYQVVKASHECTDLRLAL